MPNMCHSGLEEPISYLEANLFMGFSLPYLIKKQ